MKSIFPFFSSLKNYTQAEFKLDISAGLVVGVMLIPQGMAYAMIAGLPPVYGLYTAIFPSILYALLGTSRHVSVGPVAMDSLILLAGVSAIASIGTEQYIAYVLVISLLVGLLQLVLGMFRMGFIANFLSKPVILGFTFAAAVIISIKQLKYLLRLEPGVSPNFFSEFRYAATHLGEMHWPTLVLSLVVLTLLLIGKKIRSKFPTSLLVVVVSVLIAYLFDFEKMGIDLVGMMPTGLPSFSLPTWENLPWREVLPLVFTLALMGFVEIYSIGQRLQDRHKAEYEIDPNRELIALGLGNIIGSLFKSFPATAGFSRSAVNESAGAQTSIAAFVSVLVVVLTLIFLMPVFQYLPNAILGSIIFVAILGLIDIKLARNLLKNDPHDFAMLVASFLGTLILGIEYGIGLGIVLSLLVLIFKTSMPHMAVLGQVAGTNFYRNLDRFESAVDHEYVSILRFDARLFFANIRSLKSKVEEMVKKKPSMKKFVLDAQSMIDVDSSGMDGLEDIIHYLDERNIEFHMVNIIGPVRDKLFRSGLAQKIGLAFIHDCISDAVKEGPDETKLTYQRNLR